ncbi:hypothetical protein TWF706_003761 [Orbilia oligospora]|nr:hypothetical protein TWF706_003761 [Orbilia oligospora]
MHLHRPCKQIDLLLNFLLVEERPFSFHSTYILDSLPYGHSAFRKGFPVKFIQAEIYGILALYMKLRFCPFKALCHTSFFYNLP